MLYNDSNLKDSEVLPDTCMETDSFAAVRLLEKYGELRYETIADNCYLLGVLMIDKPEFV